MTLIPLLAIRSISSGDSRSVRGVRQLVHAGVQGAQHQFGRQRVGDHRQPGAVRGVHDGPDHPGLRHRPALRAGFQGDLDQVDAGCRQPLHHPAGLGRRADELGVAVGAPAAGRVAAGRGQDRAGDRDERRAGTGRPVPGAPLGRPGHRSAQVAHPDQAGALAGHREPAVRVGDRGRVEAQVHVRVHQPRHHPVAGSAEHRQVGGQACRMAGRPCRWPAARSGRPGTPPSGRPRPPPARRASVRCRRPARPSRRRRRPGSARRHRLGGAARASSATRRPTLTGPAAARRSARMAPARSGFTRPLCQGRPANRHSVVDRTPGTACRRPRVRCATSGQCRHRVRTAHRTGSRSGQRWSACSSSCSSSNRLAGTTPARSTRLSARSVSARRNGRMMPQRDQQRRPGQAGQADPAQLPAQAAAGAGHQGGHLRFQRAEPARRRTAGAPGRTAPPGPPAPAPRPARSAPPAPSPRPASTAPRSAGSPRPTTARC